MNSKILSVLPGVLLCGRTTEIELKVNDLPDGEYLLRIFPVSYPSGKYAEPKPVNIVDGKAMINIEPDREQEYRLVLYKDRDWLADCFVYAVKEDLYELNPYKGDFHMHSNQSDGKEPPAEVAAQGRAIGFDIMAVTDHGLYNPSLEAIAAYEGVKLDIKLCPGEEVHPPKNPVHIINFGGRASVNALFDTQEYKQGVTEIQANLPPLKDGCDPYEYASSLWVFNKIRELGGMSIFCHPYWRFPYYEAAQDYYISEGLTSQMFEDRPFDAYEVLGGYSLAEQDSNTLQTARYSEERQRGPLPIVGVSDAHGCCNELFGWYFTIVFSKECTLEGIKEGICALRSIAVEKLPGREARAYGPFRLVQFALFLLREYFPTHDALCAQEGQLMKDWINSDKTAGDKLAGLSGQTDAWIKKFYGR
ncbi:MAG TPA: PHP domain-containing protein [Clostridiales bacterium]|nr:PHP domain-containing protein [Clostridiales bacterium]